MSYAPTPASANRIDIGDQVGRAYRTLLDNTQLAGELALIPYAIVLGAEIVAYLLPGGHLFGLILAVLVRAAALLLVGSIFAVRWHRFVLLDERVAGSLPPPGWSVFVVAGLKVAALMMAGWLVLVLIAVLPPHMITAPLSAVGSILLGFLAARLSLIFPAAAVERPLSLRAGWDLMQGNYWRLLICALVCYLPFLVVQVIIGWIAGSAWSLLWVVFEAVRLAAAFAGVAVIAAMLSQVYRELVAA